MVDLIKTNIYENKHIKHNEFEPYDNNGGTIVGIAGKNFVILAGDTRLSTGYQIYSRSAPKTYHFPNVGVLGMAGFQADANEFAQKLYIEIDNYFHDHKKHMKLEAFAQVISNSLYSRRFFPYYIHCILAGFDSNGDGAIYSYDSIGSGEKLNWSASGTGSELILPILDSMLGDNTLGVPSKSFDQVNVNQALELVKTVFTSAAERDIYTGDLVEIWICSPNGVNRELFPLRHD